MTIVDFCGHCGILLEPGAGKREDPRCTNCGGNVKERENRIQGLFEDSDAERLHNPPDCGTA